MSDASEPTPAARRPASCWKKCWH